MNNFTFYSPTLFTFGDGEEKNTGALVRRFGTAEAAYFADPGEYELLSLSERLCRSLADKSLERAERILGDCDRLGVTLLTYQDAAYPERLLQLHDFPLVLYVKGRLFRFCLLYTSPSPRDCS